MKFELKNLFVILTLNAQCFCKKWDDFTALGKTLIAWYIKCLKSNFLENNVWLKTSCIHIWVTFMTKKEITTAI